MSRAIADLAAELADHSDERVRDLAQGYHRLLVAHLTSTREKRVAFDDLQSAVGFALSKASRVIVGE